MIQGKAQYPAAVPPRRYTLPRSYRLGGRRAFGSVFDAGVRAAKGPLTVFIARNTLKHPRIGMSVGRRVGGAAQRNRIKRLLREAFRHLRHDFPEAYDLVIVVRPHEPLPLAEYQRLLSALLVRAHQAWAAGVSKATRKQ